REEITSATAACSLLWISGCAIVAVLASTVAGSICQGRARPDSAAEVGRRAMASDWIRHTGWAARTEAVSEASDGAVPDAGQARPGPRSRGWADSGRAGPL